MGFLPNIGTTELLIIAFILLLFFGGKKLNEWARGLGESGRELKNIKKELLKSTEALDKTEDEPLEETKKGKSS